jgi:hypothetical protein
MTCFHISFYLRTNNTNFNFLYQKFKYSGNWTSREDSRGTDQKASVTCTFVIHFRGLKRTSRGQIYFNVRPSGTSVTTGIEFFPAFFIIFNPDISPGRIFWLWKSFQFNSNSLCSSLSLLMLLVETFLKVPSVTREPLKNLIGPHFY